MSEVELGVVITSDPPGAMSCRTASRKSPRAVEVLDELAGDHEVDRLDLGRRDALRVLAIGYVRFVAAVARERDAVGVCVEADEPCG